MNENTPQGRQLTRLLAAMPSIRAYVISNAKDDEASWKIWTQSFAACHIDDLTVVINEVCDGRWSPVGQFEKPDAARINIRERANAIRTKRDEEARMADLVSRGPTVPRDIAERFGRAIRCSAALGESVKFGLLNREENRSRMLQVHDYHDGHTNELPEVPAGLKQARQRTFGRSPRRRGADQ